MRVRGEVQIENSHNSIQHIDITEVRSLSKKFNRTVVTLERKYGDVCGERDGSSPRSDDERHVFHSGGRGTKESARPVATRRADGGCGRSLRWSSSKMTKHRLPPLALISPHKPHLQTSPYLWNRVLRRIISSKPRSSKDVESNSTRNWPRTWRWPLGRRGVELGSTALLRPRGQSHVLGTRGLYSPIPPAVPGAPSASGRASRPRSRSSRKTASASRR